MRTEALLLSALALPACHAVPSNARATTATAPPVEVMVLGTYHFANPGLDVVNVEADDVLTEERQRQLRELSRRLATFRPTVVALEARRTRDDGLDPRFLDFTPQQLLEDRDERVQIAHRLAHDVGLARVYAVDEQEGELPFFPFDRVQAFAEAHDRAHVLETMIAEARAEAAAFADEQEDTPIWDLLARHNDPDEIRSGHERFYYSLLSFSTREDHAGAALNYGWYARNAVIFANLTEVTRPGDRVVLLYGAGHAYWLRHFVERTPGFELVDPLPYLRGDT